MTEQEKREGTSEEDAVAEGDGGEAKEAEQRRAAEGASQPSARQEAGEAGAAEKERRPARAEREVAPAGPQTAVVTPRRAPGQPAVSRRRILQIGFWSSLGAMVAGTLAGSLDFIYPSRVTGFGGKVTVSASEIPPSGEKAEIAAGRFWLANLTQEQGGPGLLALWWKCPHLGCTVPWKSAFVWPDPSTGADKQGWFRCPCHGSTYTDAGVLVFGPAPRSMDTMDLVVEDGRITVDTGKITPGGPDNPDRAVRT